MFKSHAKANPANLRKRALAALEAAESGEAMAGRWTGKNAKRAATAFRNAAAWAREAERLSTGR